MGWCLLTWASCLAFFDSSESVGVSETSSVDEGLTLLTGGIVEVVGMFSRAWSLNLWKGADVLVVLASSLTLLFVLESVVGSLTSSVMESVTGSVGLVVVPFGGKVGAWSGVLSLVTDRVGSSWSITSRLSLCWWFHTKRIALILAGESVGVSSTSGVLEWNTGSGGNFIVP